MAASGYGTSFRGDEKVLKLIMNMGEQLCKYAKKH